MLDLHCTLRDHSSKSPRCSTDNLVVIKIIVILHLWYFCIWDFYPEQMLLQHLPQLAPHRVVLASASPRRHELMALLGLKCEVVPSTFEENLPHADHTPVTYVRETARHKTLEVARRLAADGSPPPSLIIGADTVQ